MYIIVSTLYGQPLLQDKNSGNPNLVCKKIISFPSEPHIGPHIAVLENGVVQDQLDR